MTDPFTRPAYGADVVACVVPSAYIVKSIPSSLSTFELAASAKPHSIVPNSTEKAQLNCKDDPTVPFKVVPLYGEMKVITPVIGLESLIFADTQNSKQFFLRKF